MTVDTVSVVPISRLSHGENSKCPTVRNGAAVRCPGHDAPMILLYAVRLTRSDIGAAIRAYQVTDHSPLPDTLRLLIEATLQGMIHRGNIGKRADDLAARGDIEIGRASTL